jgi:hypothetical protein
LGCSETLEGYLLCTARVSVALGASTFGGQLCVPLVLARRMSCDLPQYGADFGRKVLRWYLLD